MHFSRAIKKALRWRHWFVAVGTRLLERSIDFLAPLPRLQNGPPTLRATYPRSSLACAASGEADPAQPCATLRRGDDSWRRSVQREARDKRMRIGAHLTKAVLVLEGMAAPVTSTLLRRSQLTYTHAESSLRPRPRDPENPPPETYACSCARDRAGPGEPDRGLARGGRG